MENLRLFVELPADPMAAEFADHAIAVALGVLLYRVPDIAEVRARAHRLDAAPQAIECHFAESPRLD